MGIELFFIAVGLWMRLPFPSVRDCPHREIAERPVL